MSSDFILLPRKIFESNMPAGCIRIYAYLRGYCISSNTCWPSVRTILKEMPINKADTIARYIKRFDPAFVRVTKRYNQSNKYWCRPVGEIDYTIIDMGVITSPNLTHKEFLLYCALAASYVDESGTRSTRKADIIKMCKTNRDTWARAIEKLSTHGLYESIGGSKAHTDYKLFFSSGELHTGKKPSENRGYQPEYKIIPLSDFRKLPSDFWKLPSENGDSKKIFKINLRSKFNNNIKDFSFKNSTTEEKKENNRFSAIEPNNKKSVSHTENKKESFSFGGSKPPKKKRFNRRAIRANAPKPLPGKRAFAIAMKGFREQMKSEDKAIVCAYVRHEVRLADFSGKSAKEIKQIVLHFLGEALQHRLKDKEGRKKSIHRIYAHFINLTPEQRQAELDNSGVWQEKLKARTQSSYEALIEKLPEDKHDGVYMAMWRGENDLQAYLKNNLPEEYAAMLPETARA